MKKIIFSFCALVAFMNAEAQVLEVWMQKTPTGTASKVLSCPGPDFTAEVYTQTNGTNSVDINKSGSSIHQYRNSNATWGANGEYYHVRVRKTEGNECLWGEAPKESEAVDLGIQITLNNKTYKVLWAPWNLGGSSTDGNGLFFSYGEDGTQYAYNSVSREPTNFVSGNVTVTDADIANQWWGGNWQIPPKEALEELVKLTWTRNDPSIFNYISGSIFGNIEYFSVTSTNGNGIIMPCLGYYSGTRNEETSGWFEASACNYLSNTLSGDYVNILHVYKPTGTMVKKVATKTEDTAIWGDNSVNYQKYFGYSIRPVMLVPVE